MDLPNIIYDSCSFRDTIAIILIVTDSRVRYTQESRWHPSETFFHTASDIGKVRNVVEVRYSITTDSIELLMCCFDHLGEDHYSLHESY